MEAFQEIRTRVNGKFLTDHSGKPVSMIAQVVKVNPNGMTVDVKSTDNQDISVILNQPMSEPLTGWIEIRGTGQGRCHILAQHLLSFPSHIATNFDSDLYDDIVNVLNTCKNPYVKSE